MYDLTSVLRLSDAEMKLAYLIGESRHMTCAREKRVGDPLTSKRDEVIGSMGEIAFARMMNKYPNLVTDVQPGSPDYVIGDATIDVKATHDPGYNRNLVVPLHKAQRGACDFYVLVSVVERVCTVAGFAYGRIVFSSATKDLGWGSSYYVERKYLRPIQELREAIHQLHTTKMAMSPAGKG